MITTERISIENFAGIQRVDLDLDGINVLIGPQAVGKSVCAKLLYYFKSFPVIACAAAERQQGLAEVDAELKLRFEQYFPPPSWTKGPFHIRYEVGDTSVDVRRGSDADRGWELSYSRYWRDELNGVYEQIGNLSAGVSPPTKVLDRGALTGIREGLFRRANERIGDHAGFETLFVPAGRSFFAFLESSIFGFLSAGNLVDPFLLDFGGLYERLKRLNVDSGWLDESRRDLRNITDPVIQEILRGRHYQEKGRDFLEMADGRRVAVANSSSGQQEMLPLAVILGLLPVSSFGGAGTSVFIEEPEAHLFPTAQRLTIELLVTVFNSALVPAQFIITTHSPYILTAFNNLLQAGRIARDPTKRAELESIVPSRQILDPDAMRAYSLSDGSAKSIISEEFGIIDTNAIDEVSNDLSIQFGKLLDIEE